MVGTMVRVLGIVLSLTLLQSAAMTDSLWDYQAVDASGNATHPLVGADLEEANRVTLEGVALAGYDEILNPNVMYSIFLQDDTEDKGGLQVWSGMFWYGGNWRPPEFINFQAGDKIRVNGFLEDHNGKVFINDRHSPSLTTRFTVEVIGHPGIPDPERAGSVSNVNYFDQTRADGGERYQTRFIMLNDLHINVGTWGNNQTLSVGDDSGDVSLLLSEMGNFSSAPTAPFTAVGIMDQEDATAPFTGDYRLWVKKQEDIAKTIPAVALATVEPIGAQIALINKFVSRSFGSYFYIQDEKGGRGIRVNSTRSVEPGDIVNVLGTVSLIEGERTVEPRYITVEGGNSVKALAISSNGFQLSAGLDPSGLLVKAVVKIGSDNGDGTANATDDNRKPVLLKKGTLTLPAVDSFAVVTGIIKKGAPPTLQIARQADIDAVN